MILDMMTDIGCGVLGRWLGLKDCWMGVENAVILITPPDLAWPEFDSWVLLHS